MPRSLPCGGRGCYTGARARCTSPRRTGAGAGPESASSAAIPSPATSTAACRWSPLAEALLAATQDLSRNSLRLVLARAEYARLLDRPSLEAVIGSGRPGARALRGAVHAHLPALARCANPREREFVLLCEREGLAIPEPNARVGRYRPDMLWADAMVVVELDGEAAHSSPAQLGADARRQAELEALGYTVLRFTHVEVRLRPAWVASRVRRHLL